MNASSEFGDFLARVFGILQLELEIGEACVLDEAGGSAAFAEEGLAEVIDGAVEGDAGLSVGHADFGFAAEHGLHDEVFVAGSESDLSHACVVDGIDGEEEGSAFVFDAGELSISADLESPDVSVDDDAEVGGAFEFSECFPVGCVVDAIVEESFEWSAGVFGEDEIALGLCVEGLDEVGGCDLLEIEGDACGT